MKKTLLAALAICCLSINVAHADYVNFFNCSIKDGHTVKDLKQLRLDFMQAVKEAGVAPGYKTEIMVPLYNDIMNSEPETYRWKGTYSDGAEWGRINDWFFTTEWPSRFDKIANCNKASLWLLLD